jgi:hypothetical protein
MQFVYCGHLSTLYQLRWLSIVNSVLVDVDFTFLFHIKLHFIVKYNKVLIQGDLFIVY